MKLTVSLLGESYRFHDLKELFAKANEEKSGDQLAGIAAADDRERMAAKLVLADLTLADIRSHPLLPPETDEVSRVIEEGVDEAVYETIRNWTVGELREHLLAASETEVRRIGRGLNSEMAAAAAS